MIGTLNQPDQNPRRIQAETGTGALLVMDNDGLVRRYQLNGLLDQQVASYDETSKRMGFVIEGMGVVSTLP